MYTIKKGTLILEEKINSVSCPVDKELMCGRIIVEKEKYLEEISNYEKIIKNIDKDRAKYEKYFDSMLKVILTIIEPTELISELFKSYLININHIKYGYKSVDENVISFYIFMEEENWDIEEEIYEQYERILDQFPDKEIDLNLARLWGRRPESLIPGGYQEW